MYYAERGFFGVSIINLRRKKPKRHITNCLRLMLVDKIFDQSKN
jgi:hypothetical protein